ncbi:SDR family NAD(P)-dependent oxidoreductase [Flavobacterium sp.]|uniref:SDR family NAD(P)-dependent oxidoreductase n=1 Tax=Flavobacterium sp. TaxID=239 RepID=UPI002605D5FD|nr:SDR family NAD(P)-dependent oxidoreductase [Flavobacterium sp.]
MVNKAILITGASSGMGEATAILLAKSGYTVFAGIRSQLAINKLNELCLDKLYPIILDVTKIEHINNTFEFVKKTVGENGIYAIINNAGNNYSVPTEYFDEQKARFLVETHFWGMANLTKIFLPLLRLYSSKNKNQARIINVGSVGSISAFPFIQFYNAAKFAILGFTESLRFELAPYGIKAIVIVPGSVKTSIWRRTDEAVQDSLLKLGNEGKELYQYNLFQSSKLAASMEKRGVAVEKAAKVFRKALESSNPSFKYFIGNDANVVNFMVKYLPDSLRQSFLKMKLRFKSIQINKWKSE